MCALWFTITSLIELLAFAYLNFPNTNLIQQEINVPFAPNRIIMEMSRLH